MSDEKSLCQEIREYGIPKRSQILKSSSAIMITFALFSFIIGLLYIVVEMYPYMTVWHKAMLLGGMFLLVGVGLDSAAKEMEDDAQ